MDLYRKVRLACAEGMSQREAARHFNVSRDTVAKMMAFSVPPGYRRTAPVKRPKLDAFTGIIDGWLENDCGVHRKQRHTAKRVFERLRDEHGFTGGYTIVKDYMRERERLSTPEQKPATWRRNTRPVAGRYAPWRVRSPGSWRVPWRIGPQGQSRGG